MSYQVNYKGGQAEQSSAASLPTITPVAAEPESAAPRFKLPPIAHTVVTVVAVAGVFFTVEKFGPAEWRPSHLVGSYEAEVAGRVEAQVTAAKLQQQAQYDAWLEEVRLVNAQNLEQYRGVVTAVAANYQASYDRSRVYAEATARMQTDLASARLQAAGRMRGADQSMIALSRILGLGLDAFAPGSGAPFMAYSNTLSDEVYAELDRAARSGRPVTVEGWNTGLPAPAEVQSAIQGIQLKPLPPPPTFAVTVPAAPSASRS